VTHRSLTFHKMVSNTVTVIQISTVCMTFTNLLKSNVGISRRILLVCKLEIMHFWSKACNVSVVRVYVKYL